MSRTDRTAADRTAAEGGAVLTSRAPSAGSAPSVSRAADQAVPLHSVPLPATAVDLLTRAEAELLAAQFSNDPGERFVHAHLAGLRAASAVLAVRGRPGGRRAPRTVWEMLDAVAPEVETWSAYFAGGAGLRRAVEAGRSDAVDAARAEEVLCAAEDFLDEVGELLARAALGGGAGAVPARPRSLAVRAS
ncbi:SAV_6107 family HEPN domain-containing protein [Pengzhenrongella sicca]|uniref:Colicin transporter n=1 Tax=Pengzhenrongella sicca TaxID=2819238 RepID=A0A8A4ZJG9_9MICO|nr:SAV_6107 family HEPN domain-containing protein [Pengzhenrongella sicca]QTE30646.1 colicin transporter [Pengzhenrongella sicca]